MSDCISMIKIICYKTINIYQYNYILFSVTGSLICKTLLFYACFFLCYLVKEEEMKSVKNVNMTKPMPTSNHRNLVYLQTSSCSVMSSTDVQFSLKGSEVRPLCPVLSNNKGKNWALFMGYYYVETWTIYRSSKQGNLT